MARKSIIALALFLTGYLSGFCQVKNDVLNLMNGQTFEGVLKDTANGKVLFDITKRGKIKTLEFEHYRVFSTVKERDPEFVFYKQDTAIGNYLTPDEMRYFFLGEKDARKNYNPIGLKITACVITYGISLADTYKRDTTSSNFMKGFFKSEPGVVSIVAPFVITALAGFPAVQINISKVSDRNLLNQQAYIDGFEKIGRSKKVFGALKFSLLGSVLGVASYFIAH